MFKNKGFSAIALIIILAVLALGGYAVWKNKLGSEASKSAPSSVTDTNIEPPINSNGSSSTPSVDMTTVDWKNHTETLNGVKISFKYPPLINIVERPNPYLSVGFVYPPSLIANRLRIAGYPAKETYTDLADLIADIKSKTSNNIIHVIGEVKVGADNGYEINWSGKTGVWLARSNYLYIFDFDKFTELSALDKQILLTVQFSDVAATANWKTYRNEEYGFEVKYPAIWSICTDQEKEGWWKMQENQNKGFLCIRDNIKGPHEVTVLNFSSNPELFSKYNNYLALKTYLSYRRPDILAEFGPADLLEGKTMSGESFIRGQHCDDGCQGTYYVFSKNNLLTVNYILPITYDNEIKIGINRVDDLENIFSTFRFVK